MTKEEIFDKLKSILAKEFEIDEEKLPRQLNLLMILILIQSIRSILS